MSLDSESGHLIGWSAVLPPIPLLANRGPSYPVNQPGVGPVTAAQLLISWSHPGRLRSEASFAMLAGAAPFPASSGRVVRHRLNRTVARQLYRLLERSTAA